MPEPHNRARCTHCERAAEPAVGLIGLILIALTYPGWLHPLNDQRRLKWEVEPSQSMKRAAEHIQSMRDVHIAPGSETAEPAARLRQLCRLVCRPKKPISITDSDFIAPRRKTMSRPGATLAHENARERRADSFKFEEFLTRHGVTYAVTAHPYRKYNLLALNALLSDIRNPRTDRVGVLAGGWPIRH